MGVKKHRKESPDSLRIGVITMSSTRTIDTDESGSWIAKRAKKEHHSVVCHKVIPDVEEDIRKAVRDAIRENAPDVLILNGGTGIGPEDVTIEAITPMLRKELTAFAPVFAQLSFEEIDSAAILSRALAGIIGNTAVFCLPGSLKACKLACKAIIYPEIGHIVKHVND